MTTKTKSKAKPAADPATTAKPVILTVTIFPLRNGKRPLVISGAPDGEMPVVRAGNFSEIHPLFDELWLELIKRKPKIVTKPAVKTNQPDKKTTAQADDDEDAGVGEHSAPSDESQDDAAETDASETEEASAESVAELEQSIWEAKSNPEDASDQLVRSVGETGPEAHAQLPEFVVDGVMARLLATTPSLDPAPIIENDPTNERAAAE